MMGLDRGWIQPGKSSFPLTSAASEAKEINEGHRSTHSDPEKDRTGTSI